MYNEGISEICYSDFVPKCLEYNYLQFSTGKQKERMVMS